MATRNNNQSGSEVSILKITPFVPDNLSSVTCGSGFVDLPLNEDGSDPTYTASDISNDGTNLNVTYTAERPVQMSSNISDQLYKTVMLPIYFDQNPLMSDQIGIIVVVKFPAGSTNPQGGQMSSITKKGDASGGAITTRKPVKLPNKNMAVLPEGQTSAHHVHLKESLAVDGSNPANTIGNCRFQVFQSVTQTTQYFLLVFVTGNSDQTAPAQGPFHFSENGSSLVMELNLSKSNNMVQILGSIGATMDQYDSIAMGNYGGPLQFDSEPSSIDATPGNAGNSYTNAIKM